jgi:hypothetical protein
MLISSSPGQPVELFGELLLEARQQLFNDIFDTASS